MHPLRPLFLTWLLGLGILMSLLPSLSQAAVPVQATRTSCVQQGGADASCSAPVNLVWVFWNPIAPFGEISKDHAYATYEQAHSAALQQIQAHCPACNQGEMTIAVEDFLKQKMPHLNGLSPPQYTLFKPGFLLIHQWHTDDPEIYVQTIPKPGLAVQRTFALWGTGNVDPAFTFLEVKKYMEDNNGNPVLVGYDYPNKDTFAMDGGDLEGQMGINFTTNPPNYYHQMVILNYPLCPAHTSAVLSMEEANAAHPGVDYQFWMCSGAKQFSNRAHGLNHDMSTGEGCACGGNPVDLATGEKVDQQTDLAFKGPDAWNWSRFYRSGASGWRFAYDRHVTLDQSTLPWTLTLDREDGSQVVFATTPQHLNDSTPETWVAQGDQAQTILGSVEDVKDDDGHLLGLTVHTLHDETEAYTPEGLLVSVTPRSGRSLFFDYDDTNTVMTAIEDYSGRMLTLHHDLPLDSDDPRENRTRAQTVTSVSDGETTVAYAWAFVRPSWLSPIAPPVAELTRITRGDGTEQTYTYTAEGALASIVDADGTVFAQYTYDPTNPTQLLSSVHGDNHQATTYSHDTDGTVNGLGSLGGYVQVNNAASAALGKVSGYSTPCAYCTGIQASSVTYDSFGNPTQMVGFQGLTTQRSYDTARGLVTQQVQAPGTPLARTTQVTYDPRFRLPTKTVEDVQWQGQLAHRTTLMAYDDQGDVLSRTVQAPGGPDRTWTYTYDDGLLTSETDPLGHSVWYSYGEHATLFSRINAQGQTTYYRNYTAEGLPGEIEDPNGLLTRLTYDGQQRVIRLERGRDGDHFETYTTHYASNGLMDRLTRPDGQQTRFFYTASHALQRLEQWDSQGQFAGSIDYTLDNWDRVTAELWKDQTLQPIRQRSQTYDAMNRLTQVTGAANQVSTYGYDDEGRLTQATDPGFYSVQRTYDAFNRALSTTDSLGRTTGFSYDPQDAILSATDAAGHTTGYTYNGFGDRIQLISPDAGTWAWTYDQAGRVMTQTDPRGVVRTTTYDALNRPTFVYYDGSAVPAQTPGYFSIFAFQQWVYDTCPNGKGKVCAVYDPAGVTTLGYDGWGRVTTVDWQTTSDAGVHLITHYTYDQQGRLTGITYPSGQAVTLDLDSRSHPSAIHYGSQTVAHHIQWQGLSERATSWSLGEPNGHSSPVGNTYDLDGQPDTVSDQTGLRHYQFDPSGTLHAVQVDHHPEFNQTYSYTLDHRVATASLGGYAFPWVYQYDPNGNRTLKRYNENGPGVGPTDTTYLMLTGSNRLHQVLPSDAASETQAQDAAGNLIDDGRGMTLAYDEQGHLVRALVGGLNTYYNYNAQGQRVSKFRTNGPNAGIEYEVYDLGGQLIGVYNETGGLIEEFIYLEPQRPLAMVRPGSGATPLVYPILTDHLGTPREVLDAVDHQVVWSWEAKEPFGADLPNMWVNGSPFEFRLRFPGQQQDPETGLYHNGFRDYAPQWGRYLQSDPMGLAAGWNTYAYVKGNPLDYTDPLGLAPHQYTVKDFICYASQSGCTPQNVYDQLLRYPAPFADGTPVSDGEISYIPGLGHIRHKVDPSHCSVSNITEPDHLLNPGQVTRQVVQGADGSIYVVTTGTGDGSFATLNNAFASPLWGTVDWNVASPWVAKPPAFNHY